MAVLLALAPVVAACSKSSPAPSPGSGGSASAAAAVAPSAAPAAAAGDLKVAVKHSGAAAGTFDGAKALYVKDGNDRKVVIPSGCAAFSCDVIDKDGFATAKMSKDCPSADWIIVKLNGIGQVGEPKVGTTKVQIHLAHATGGADLTSDWTDGASLTDVAADHVSGKVDMKDGGDEAHGSFAAKLCPSK